MEAHFAEMLQLFNEGDWRLEAAGPQRSSAQINANRVVKNGAKIFDQAA